MSWHQDNGFATRAARFKRFESEDRDLTNGVSVDVAIALEGGTGTLLEIGFSYACKKPTYYAGSTKQLMSKFQKHQQDGTLSEKIGSAIAKYSTVNGRALNVIEIENALRDSLIEGRKFGVDDSELERLVCDAIFTSSTAAPQPQFPGIPPDLANSKAEFSELWRQLICLPGG